MIVVAILFCAVVVEVVVSVVNKNDIEIFFVWREIATETTTQHKRNEIFICYFAKIKTHNFA